MCIFSCIGAAVVKAFGEQLVGQTAELRHDADTAFTAEGAGIFTIEIFCQSFFFSAEFISAAVLSEGGVDMLTVTELIQCADYIIAVKLRGR